MTRENAIVVATVGGIVTVALVLVGLAIGPCSPVDEVPPEEELPRLTRVPAFELVDAGGETVSAESLRGRLWVADFIFTRCASTCPEMTEMMAKLQDRLADHPEVTFVSVSVDPKYDTAEALEEYATEAGADRERWKFLRTEPETDLLAITGGFLLGSRENALHHSAKFALVDGDGWVRGFYDGAGPERVGAVVALERDIRRLLGDSMDQE